MTTDQNKSKLKPLLSTNLVVEVSHL